MTLTPMSAMTLVARNLRSSLLKPTGDYTILAECDSCGQAGEPVIS